MERIFWGECTDRSPKSALISHNIRIVALSEACNQEPSCQPARHQALQPLKHLASPPRLFLSSPHPQNQSNDR